MEKFEYTYSHRRNIKERYEHVNQRLMERHNMSISWEEFKNSTYNKLLYKTSCNSFFCTTIINGKELYAIINVHKGKKENLLRTVLPLMDYTEFPVPKDVKDTFSRLEWGYIVKNYFEYVMYIFNNMEKNITMKELYFKYPKYLAHWLKEMLEGKNINMYEFHVSIARQYSRNLKYEKI